MRYSRSQIRRKGGSNEGCAVWVGIVIGVILTFLVCGVATWLGWLPIGEKPSPFDEAKMDAEETGYNREVSACALPAEAQSKALYEALQAGKSKTSLGETTEAEKCSKTASSSHEQLRTLAKEHLGKLEKLLPPSNMAEYHKRLLAAMRDCQSKDVAAMEDPCIAFVRAARSLREQFGARATTYPSPTPINITFRPPGSPASVGVDTNGDFVFETELSISTPVGDFSLSQANATGVKKLIIRSRDKERYFSLEKKPFKVFVPTDYGVEISSEGEVLVVEVRKK